jgi:hypothetical protein
MDAQIPWRLMRAGWMALPWFPRIGCSLAFLLAVGALGCTLAARRDLSTALEADARRAIADVRFEDEESIDRVDSIRHSPQGVRAAKEALASGAVGASRWAALWITLPSDDVATLRSLQADDDSSIRLLSSAELAARGDATGLDGLVALLGVEEKVKGSRPEVSVKRFAALTLSRYTGQRPATAWASWVESRRASLRFDAGRGRWSAP